MIKFVVVMLAMLALSASARDSLHKSAHGKVEMMAECPDDGIPTESCRCIGAKVNVCTTGETCNTQTGDCASHSLRFRKAIISTSSNIETSVFPSSSAKVPSSFFGGVVVSSSTASVPEM